MATVFTTSVGLESGFQQLHSAWINNGNGPDYAGVATAVTGIIGALGPFAASLGKEISPETLAGGLSASGASLGASFLEDWNAFNDSSLTPAQHLIASLSLVSDVGQALQYIPPLEGPATGLVAAANGLQLVLQDPELQDMINVAGVNYSQTGTFNFFSIEQVGGGAIYTASPSSDGAYNSYFYSSSGNNTAIINNADGTSFIGTLDVKSGLIVNDILDLPKGVIPYFSAGNIVNFSIGNTNLSADLSDANHPTLSGNGDNYLAYNSLSGVDAGSLAVVSLVSQGANKAPTISVSPLTSSSDNPGNYTDSNAGASFRIESGEILTAVTKNQDGSWTVSSPLSGNSWNISGTDGPITLGDNGIVQIPTANGKMSLNPVTKVLEAVDSDGNPIQGGAPSQLQITGSGTTDSLQIAGSGGSILESFDPSLAPINIDIHSDDSTSFTQTKSTTGTDSNNNPTTNSNIISVTLNIPPVIIDGQSSTATISQGEILDAGTAYATQISDVQNLSASDVVISNQGTVAVNGVDFVTTAASNLAPLASQLINLLGDINPIEGIAASTMINAVAQQIANPNADFGSNVVGDFATSVAVYEVDNAIQSLGLGQVGTAAVDTVVNLAVQKGAATIASEIGTKSIGDVLSDAGTSIGNAFSNVAGLEGLGINFAVGQTLNAIYGGAPNFQEVSIGEDIGTAVGIAAVTLSAGAAAELGALVGNEFVPVIGAAVGAIIGAVAGSLFGPDNPPVGFNADQQVTWIQGTNSTNANANGYFAIPQGVSQGANNGFGSDDTSTTPSSVVNQVDSAVKNMGEGAVDALNTIFEGLSQSSGTQFSNVPVDIKFGYASGNGSGNDKTIDPGTPNWWDSIGADPNQEQEFNLADGDRQASPNDALQQGVYRIASSVTITNGDLEAERLVAEDRAAGASLVQLDSDLSNLSLYESHASDSTAYLDSAADVSTALQSWEDAVTRVEQLGLNHAASDPTQLPSLDASLATAINSVLSPAKASVDLTSYTNNLTNLISEEVALIRRSSRRLPP